MLQVAGFIHRHALMVKGRRPRFWVHDPRLLKQKTESKPKERSDTSDGGEAVSTRDIQEYSRVVTRNSIYLLIKCSFVFVVSFTEKLDWTLVVRRTGLTRLCIEV